MTARRTLWIVVIAMLLAGVSYGAWHTWHFKDGPLPLECTVQRC